MSYLQAMALTAAVLIGLAVIGLAAAQAKSILKGKITGWETVLVIVVFFVISGFTWFAVNLNRPGPQPCAFQPDPVGGNTLFATRGEMRDGKCVEATGP